METEERLEATIICDILIIILIIMGVILFIGLLISLDGESNTDNWRKTTEGICFKNIAIDFCEKNNMEFKKLYIWLYDYDFSCYTNSRGDNFEEFDFDRDEKLKCGSYYG
jgi:hypothetical protein